MGIQQYILLAIFFFVTLYTVLWMIVSFRLREVYAVIWVMVTLAIPVSVLLYPYIKGVSHLLGIPDPFYLVVFCGFMICFILLLHFSALNSNMLRSLKNAIQKIAILEDEIRSMGEIIKKNDLDT